MSAEARRRNLEIGRRRKKEMAEQKKINKARELLSKYPDKYKVEAIGDINERIDVIEKVEVAKSVVEEESDSDGVDMGEVIADHLLKKMKKPSKKASKKTKKPQKPQKPQKKKAEASESSESSESDDEITGGHSVRRGKVNVNVYNTMPEKKRVDEPPCKLKF